jgi:uncharacterized damage-inducible protein DinB
LQIFPGLVSLLELKSEAIMHRELIERYANEAGNLRKVVAGLSREQLLARPVPNTWSIQQIAIHVVDCELVFCDRMKRVIALDNPALPAFDETKYVEHLSYDDQDANIACDVFEKNRQLMFSVLRKLPDAAFERSGTHSERGKQTLTDVVRYAVDHLEHHLKFAREKWQMVQKG